MPAQRKPADRRQRGARTKDTGQVVALVPNQAAHAASVADLAWRDEVQQQWAELWSSPMAGALRPTDLPALRRLFKYRSLLLDALDRFEAEPESVGSMGQPVVSPWAAEVHRVEATIQKLEDKCGLTPMARLRLGITLEEGVSLASRNAQLLESFRASNA
jgi:hypothetical protein